MSVPPREIGTLIVVILKARNLPNKRHIGKQDPYCTVELNGDSKRTKAIKRGGQHPEWDEEVRFTLFEGPAVDTQTSPVSDVPPPPPKKHDERPMPNIQGGPSMGLACYAEYLREPEFIGETRVDLTEVLTKGETDDWFTLMNKGKYSGEVYLELTFWSNEPAPVKPKQKTKKQYGGPGSFVPSGAPSSAPSTPPGGTVTPPRDPYGSQSNGFYSSPSTMSHEASSESVPSSLRASSSVVRRDLYTAPYESARSQRSYHSMDSLTNDFAELGVQNESAKSSAYLPPSNSFTYPPPSNTPYPYLASASRPDLQEPVYGYDRASSYSEDSYNQGVNHPMATGQSQSSGSLPPLPYQAPYESNGPAQPAASRNRGPRYSLPTSSSGFVPIATPAHPGFAPFPHQSTGYIHNQASAPSGHSEPTYEQPPLAAESGFVHSSSLPQGYAPAPPRTPVPPSGIPPASAFQPSTSGVLPSQSYQSLPPPTGYYQQYAPVPHPTAPPQPYVPPPPPIHAAAGTVPSHPLPPPPLPPTGAPQMGHGQPDYGYGHTQISYAYPGIPPPPTLSHSTSTPSQVHHVSRPLPPDPPPRVRRHSTVSTSAPQLAFNSRSAIHMGYSSFAQIPPPPAIPTSTINTNGSQVTYAPNVGQQTSIPPPPPLSTSQSQLANSQTANSPSRHSSLNGYPHLPPPPPPQFQQHTTSQLPPPPPPPGAQGHHYQTASVHPDADSYSIHPGPLPRPPQYPPYHEPIQNSPVTTAEWQ